MQILVQRNLWISNAVQQVLKPDAVVIGSNCKGIKIQWRRTRRMSWQHENLEAVKKGIVNLEKHIENIQKFGVPVVVTLNSFCNRYTRQNMNIFSSSVRREAVSSHCPRYGQKGGEGGVELWQKKVLETLENKESLNYHPLYPIEMSLER